MDQPGISLTLHLTNLCKTGNAHLAAVQISPIPFHQSQNLPSLPQKTCKLSRNSYLDHFQLLKSINQSINKGERRVLGNTKCYGSTFAQQASSRKIYNKNYKVSVCICLYAYVYPYIPMYY